MIQMDWIFNDKTIKNEATMLNTILQQMNVARTRKFFYLCALVLKSKRQ